MPTNGSDRSPTTAARARTHAVRVQAWRGIDAAVDARTKAYDRAVDLPKLLPLLAGDMEDRTEIIQRLDRALKRERTLGRHGHWAYDLGRHFALRAALSAERDSIEEETLNTQKKRRHPEG